MQKVILDTNVIISSLIQKNYPYLIVNYCISEKVEICLSNAILKAYIVVLKRSKFHKFKDFYKNAEFFLLRLGDIAELYEPKLQIDIIEDEPDNRFLELAQISKADYLITVNSNDFRMRVFEKTEIISPKAYWEIINRH